MCVQGMLRVRNCLPKQRFKAAVCVVLLWIFSFQVAVFLFLHGSSLKPLESLVAYEQSVRNIYAQSLKQSLKTIRGTSEGMSVTITNTTSQAANTITPESFIVRHANLDRTLDQSIKPSAKLVLVVPHGLTKKEEISGLEFLQEGDLQNVLRLGKLLTEELSDFDGATCVAESHTRAEEISDENQTDILGKYQEILRKTWCHFSRNQWSLQIRNCGNISSINLNDLLAHNKISRGMRSYVFQTCNVLDGAFVIRRDSFMQIKHRSKYGRLGNLDFFLRSGGHLKMAKFGNMFLSDSLHKVDRGVKEGVPEFPDYAHFGNDHGILRIVQEDRIEWTTCIANGQQCKEKPYSPPVELPRLGMPICCMVVLDRMLQDITNALNTIGIRYRVIYGTLLGGIRSKAIIPWTHDVDLALDKDICSNRTFFSKLQDHFGGMYYLGHYFMDMPRMVPHIPAYIEVNNSSLFKEGYCRMDLDQGFYSEEIKKSIESLTPLSLHWRDRGYLDFNPAPDIWWNGSALVEINRKKYITIRDIDYELKNWYGYDYMKPALHGETWNGLSDVGA